MWDLFISHASEDKENLVRPLATELARCGVDVWYDEFTLNLGDSLTASIDKGLLESKYGLVIISKAFFEKNWTDYELKSLLTKEINTQKVILPIWHDVTPSFVASKSLYLADKKALSSDVGVSKLAYEIIKIVRPDIINSHMLKAASRQLRNSGAVEQVNFGDVIENEIQHESLPVHLLIASRIFPTLLSCGTYKEVITNFARDNDYTSEFVIWTVISCAYIDAVKEYGIPLGNEKKNRDYFAFLLLLSMKDDQRCQQVELSDEEKAFLMQAYMRHAEILFQFIRNQ